MRLATAFDGQFYPGEREELIEWVDGFLAAAPAPPGDLLGAVVPHAGYIYSGRAAGRAIGIMAQDPPDAVVVLGPSHRTYFEGLRVLDIEGYETPLGPLPADPTLAEELAAGLAAGSLSEGFAEHSVEVQLPLLARALPGVPVVQVVFGQVSGEEIHRFVEVLLRLRETRRLLVVASSDLSHFHSREEALRLDGRFWELLADGDPQRLAEAVDRGETEACGLAPVLTLMELSQRLGARFELVEQCDSSQASGEDQRVVGYLSAVSVLPEDC